MPTLLLTIAYDGTNYSGWQVQPNGTTVQQLVEAALERVLGEPVQLRSSGRTDAGVHARGMSAAFDTGRDLPLKAFVEGTNRFLPDDIAIQEARFVHDGFKPLALSVAKLYRYTIINAPIRSPLDRLYCWQIPMPLDLEAMREGARLFVGEHDFSAFRASNCVAKTTVRRIDSVTVIKSGPLIVIDVIGGGFLKYMVRIMAGTLVDIGKGRFAPSHVAALLSGGKRKEAGCTAPASGLSLIEVFYPEAITSR